MYTKREIRMYTCSDKIRTWLYVQFEGDVLRKNIHTYAGELRSGYVNVKNELVGTENERLE